MEEYVSVLEKFIKKCKEVCKNNKKEEIRIVICGDLLHSKNQLSPNLITITSFFLVIVLPYYKHM